MGSGSGNEETSGQTGRTGLPKYQNQTVRGAIGNSQNVYNQDIQGVNNVSAPASVSPNSSGLVNPNAPQYPIYNPAQYGGQINGNNVSGGPLNNPNFPGGQYGGSAYGGTPSSNLPNGGGGVANLGNLGGQYGENVLSGQYLNPSSNPYEQAAMNSADQATIQNYETAIAPTTNAEFAMADNFGGSAMMYQQANNQYQLANALGNINTNMANNAYNTGIQQQEQTASQIPGLQQSQYASSVAPLTYQNQYNQGLMGLMSPYGYNQQNQYAPQQGITPGQGIGAGLGLAGLALY